MLKTISNTLRSNREEKKNNFHRYLSLIISTSSNLIGVFYVKGGIDLVIKIESTPFYLKNFVHHKVQPLWIIMWVAVYRR